MTSKSPLTHLDHISLLYHPACLSGVLQLQMWPLTHFLNVVLLLSGMPRPARMVNSYSSLKSLVTHYFVWEDLQKVLCTKYKALLHCSFSGWQTLAGIFSVFPVGDSFLFISVSLASSSSSGPAWVNAMSSPSASKPGPSTSPPAISLQQWESQVLSCLNILHSLCVRETGLHQETSAVPWQVILGAILVTLLILGGGLYLWKTCGSSVQFSCSVMSCEPRDCSMPGLRGH